MVSERVRDLLEYFDKDIGNTIKEELSFAYIRAISSICAFSCDRPNRDRGIDFNISPLKPLEGAALRNPIIKIQAKSTADNEIIKEDHLHYPLKVK